MPLHPQLPTVYQVRFGNIAYLPRTDKFPELGHFCVSFSNISNFFTLQPESIFLRIP